MNRNTYRTRKTKTDPMRHRRRFFLEPLEDRRLLSTTITVNTLVDEFGSTDQDTSLRDAIAQAEPGDTIDFSVTGTINLTLGPVVLDNLILDGPGATLLAINGNQMSGVFTTSGTTTIEGVTITGGKTTLGGGGINNKADGILTVKDSVVTGNSAQGGGGIYTGGYIGGPYSQLTVDNSTISDNKVLGVAGGGPYYFAGNGGGIMGFRSDITVDNSTISGNVASSDSLSEGGGIFGGTATISNSTISGNSADKGGGVYSFGFLAITNSTIYGNEGLHGTAGIPSTYSGGILCRNGPGAVVANSTITNNDTGIYAVGATLTNSIVSGNGANIAGSLNAATSRNNLMDDAATAGGLTNGVNGNIVGVADPGLGALVNNGGPTKTCALLSYSPAINAGDNSLIPIDPSTGSPFTTDQTGAPRIFNGTVDIGAVEFQGTPVDSTVVNTTADDVSADGLTSLREAIAFAERSGGVVTFDPTVFASPQTIALTQEQAGLIDGNPGGLVVDCGNGAVSIAGPGAGLLTVQGEPGTPVFNVIGSSPATISGMTITGAEPGAEPDLQLMSWGFGSGVPTSGKNLDVVGLDNSGLLQIRIFDANGVSGDIFESIDSEGLLDLDFRNNAGEEGFIGHETGADPASLLPSGQISAITSLKQQLPGWLPPHVLSSAEREQVLSEVASLVSSQPSIAAGILNEGNLTLASSVVTGNRNSGIINDGALTVSNSNISGNTSGGFDGGGIRNIGTATISNSTISGNTANPFNGSGGGIANYGAAAISNSTISGNTAAEGGGISNEHSIALQLNVHPTLTISDSTISGNQGGGISNGGTATISDSTISGNTARTGGGIFNDGTATISNSTISGNAATTVGGGGIYIRIIVGGAAVTIVNSIVAGNLSLGSPSDIGNNLTAASVHNLIGDAATAGGLVNGVNGNIVGVDPLLGQLADNGGPTQTMALLAGSPAIDNGDNTLVPIDPSTGLPVTTDQRGFTRVVNGSVDIGAFEDQLVVTTPADAQATTAGSVATVGLGSFTDSAINAGNSTVVVDFGDGSPTMTLLNVAPGSLGSVTHNFTSNGTYTVTVTATDQFSDANLGTLAVVVSTPTAISVSASSATPAFGQPETFTATVTTPGGDPIPTSSDGMVTFYDGTTVLGSETLSGSPATATLSTSALAPGPHTITASYSGDANFVASGPAGVLVTVTVPVSATFLTEDTTTRGNWIGAYGTEGYNDLGSAVSNPTYATITPAGQALYTWATPPLTATQALQVPPPGTSRIAAAWYSSTSFTVDVNVAAGHSYNLELYFLDYDARGRTETVTLSDPSTGTTLNSQSVSNFASGEYLVWTISGNVLITITRTAGLNALLSGLFFDPAGSPAPAQPPVATASFLDADTTTQGNWIGMYGTEGYNDLGSGVNNPTYATVTPAGQSLYTWATPPFSAGQALQVPPAGISRIAAAWYSSTSFTIDVNVAAGHSYDLELYFVDYDAHGRAETVTLTDSSTGTTLNSQSVSNFASGEYLVWTISGNVLITITRTAGINSVLDGLFFDPAGPPLPPPPPTATASFVGSDTTTQGNWIGVYGAQGFNDLGSGVSNPTGATVTPAGQTLYTWATPAFSAGQALLVPPAGMSRIAAAWYSAGSFTIDVNVAAGDSYNLELYFLDYDARGRAETVTLSSANTGTTLNSQSVSNFASGEYLVWTISGNVLITITRTAGVNAVLSGLFFDAAPAPEFSTTAVSAGGASGGNANGSSAVEEVATGQIGALSPLEQESSSPDTSLAALDAVLSSGPIATLNDASGTDHSHNGSATTFPEASNVTDLRDELVYDVALEQISGNPKRARSILGYI